MDETMMPCVVCGRPGHHEGEHREDVERLARLSRLKGDVLSMMVKRGWSLHWIHRSAYLHLEAAELAEAVRGKHGDTLEESGDVLITLLALSPHRFEDICEAAAEKVGKLMSAPAYESEVLAPGQEST